MNRLNFALAVFLFLGASVFAQRQMEFLDRGIVAVRSGNVAFVSWRSLATDDERLGFNVYRSTDGKAIKLNSTLLTAGTNYTDNTVSFTKANTYFVKKVLDGVELETIGSYTMPANKGTGPYVTVPIKSGTPVHFVWVGDLNGDGAFDYVLDRPTEEHQKIEAYLSNGTYLWTLDLGVNSENKNNISPGPSTIDVGMWDGVTVYDIDGDGYADVLVRIAEEVVFGDGKKHTTKGQAIAVLDGRTGALKYSIQVPNDYESVGPLACMMEIAYLDGKTPSLICWFKNRNANKSFNSLTVAYQVKNGKLVQQWKYDNKQGYAEAHQIRVADVDFDGKDEVLHMGYALNGNGTLRHRVEDVVHGDRWYVGAFSKNDNVMMGYGIQQTNPNGLLEYYYNASTGKIQWKNAVAPGTAGDVGRGSVGDIDPTYEGFEVWSFQGVFNGPTGTRITTTESLYPVLRYWWDGDLLSDSYNDGKIESWNYKNKSVNRLVSTWKVYPSSGSERGVAMFHGDILGDWREESILVNYETAELVIFTTDVPTDHRIYSLAQNPCYRMGMTAKGYVQASMLDYFLGHDMDKPKTPNIAYVGGDKEPKFGDVVSLLEPENKAKFNLKVSRGNMTLNFENTSAQGKVFLMDIAGHVLSAYDTYNLKTLNFSTSNMASGRYLLTYDTQNHKKTQGVFIRP